MKKVEVTVVCDLEPPESGDVTAQETVRFGYGAARYEIDACEPHAAELHGYLSALAGRATQVRGTAPANGRGPANGAAPRQRRPPRQPEYHAAVREWARQHGLEVSDRGRIAADVIARYDSEHPDSPPAPARFAAPEIG